MFINLFKKLSFSLLLLLLYFTVYGHARANGVASSPSGDNNVKLFKKNEEIKNALNPKGEQRANLDKVDSYYSPSLVATDDMMIAVVGVNRTGKAEDYIDILTKYIEMNEGWSEKVFTSTNWSNQLAVEKTAVLNSGTYIVKGLLAAAKQNKVYLLVVNYTNTPDSSISELDLKLVVGTVKDRNSSKNVEWGDPSSLSVNVSKNFKRLLDLQRLESSPLSGSSFFTKEGNIVFAIVAKYGGRAMTALIHSNISKPEPEFLYKEIDDRCYLHYFPWEEKIIMVPVDCDAKKKKMELSDNLQETQSDSTGTFSSHCKFLKNKHNFVTIKNVSKEILLFTENKQETAKSIYLWMSDGTRLKNIGKIVSDSEKIIRVNFLFVNGKLFSLNWQFESGNKINGVKLKYLKKHSGKIRNTINVWNTTDTEVLKLCKKQYASEISCVTNGLVGFLSNSADGDTTWKDEYLNINATVTPAKGKAEKIENGFKFSGKGAGAKWPLSEQSNDQPYNFINPGFTLVATVSVGKDTKDKKISILGVSLTENTKVGLWCTNDDKWGVSEKDGQINKQLSEMNCTSDKTYYVALSLRNNNEIFVYVNGQQLSKINIEEIQITLSQDTAYFYFGTDSKANEKETDVNITNVLLYNWPFEEEKITQLKPKKTTVADSQQTTQPENDQTTKPDKGTTHTKKPACTSPTKNETKEKQSSPPPTTEDSAVRVGVVGVLCFMLFGVFTLSGRYV